MNCPKCGGEIVPYITPEYAQCGCGWRFQAAPQPAPAGEHAPSVYVIAKSNGCYDDELFNDRDEAEVSCSDGERVIELVPQSALAASQAEVKRLRELIERVWNIVDHGGYVGSATSAAEVIDLFAAFDARKSKSKIQGRNTPPQRSEP